MSLFHLANEGLTSTPSAPAVCGVETILSYSAGPLHESSSAEACVMLQAFCWLRQHQKCLPLFFSFSVFVLVTLSSSLHCGTSGRNYSFSSLLTSYNETGH